MYLFFESINYNFGKYHLLKLHQLRINKAFAEFFKGKRPHQLENILPKKSFLNQYKTRFIYNDLSFKFEFIEYKKPKITSLKLYEISDTFDYSFKYFKRDYFVKAEEKNKENQVCLFMKKGQITDTSFSNIIFQDTYLNWFTPKTYLLNGVMRQYLLNKKIIQTKVINKYNLKNFSHFFLINAMNNIDLSKKQSINMIN